MTTVIVNDNTSGNTRIVNDNTSGNTVARNTVIRNANTGSRDRVAAIDSSRDRVAANGNDIARTIAARRSPSGRESQPVENTDRLANRGDVASTIAATSLVSGGRSQSVDDSLSQYGVNSSNINFSSSSSADPTLTGTTPVTSSSTNTLTDPSTTIPSAASLTSGSPVSQADIINTEKLRLESLAVSVALQANDTITGQAEIVHDEKKGMKQIYDSFRLQSIFKIDPLDVQFAANYREELLLLDDPPDIDGQWIKQIYDYFVEQKQSPSKASRTINQINPEENEELYKTNLGSSVLYPRPANVAGEVKKIIPLHIVT